MKQKKSAVNALHLLFIDPFPNGFYYAGLQDGANDL